MSGSGRARSGIGRSRCDHASFRGGYARSWRAEPGQRRDLLPRARERKHAVKGTVDRSAETSARSEDFGVCEERNEGSASGNHDLSCDSDRLTRCRQPLTRSHDGLTVVTHDSGRTTGRLNGFADGLMPCCGAL